MSAANTPICLTVLISSLTIGGAEQLLLALLKAIDRRRFEVRLIFLRQPGILGQEFLHLGFEVETEVLKNRFDFVGIGRLAQRLKTARTQVLLLINHRNTLFFGVLAAKLAGVKGIVNWENETFLKYSFHKVTMFGRWLLHLGIDRVVAAAKGHRDYIARHEKIPYRKIVSIYNGVDPARFRSGLSKRAAKARLSIPPESPVVSIIAVLRPDKAHEMFLEAAGEILKSVPETHFLIIGDGPQRNHLEAAAQKLSIAANVHFLGFQRDLGDILAAVDVNTLSSKPEQETLSVAAIEAMSVGIPIVCTAVGFMHEIVLPGRNGFLVPVGEPQQLAAKIVYMLQHRTVLAEMSRNAKAMVSDKLSVTGMARSFESLFEALLLPE